MVSALNWMRTGDVEAAPMKGPNSLQLRRILDRLHRLVVDAGDLVVWIALPLARQP